jgi:RHS repeat-associated protein
MLDRDEKTAWTAASDGTLEERVYYVQNWRSDVVALVNAAGAPLEEIRSTAYGTPSSHPIADVNGDGVVGTADVTAWDDLFASTGTLAVYEHNNLDRDELFPGDAGDDGFFYDQYAKTPNQAYGVNALSYLGNRKGYAGYEWDETARTWHVRHRVLDSASGKWTRMDPLGYVDGAGVNEYVMSCPLTATDAAGLARQVADGGVTIPIVPPLNTPTNPRWWEPVKPARVKLKECLANCNSMGYVQSPSCISSCYALYPPEANICCWDYVGLRHCEIVIGTSCAGAAAGATLKGTYPLTIISTGTMLYGPSATGIACANAHWGDVIDCVSGCQAANPYTWPTTPNWNCQKQAKLCVRSCCVFSMFALDPLASWTGIAIECGKSWIGTLPRWPWYP